MSLVCAGGRKGGVTRAGLGDVPDGECGGECLDEVLEAGDVGAGGVEPEDGESADDDEEVGAGEGGQVGVAAARGKEGDVMGRGRGRGEGDLSIMPGRV